MTVKIKIEFDDEEDEQRWFEQEFGPFAMPPSAAAKGGQTRGAQLRAKSAQDRQRIIEHFDSLMREDPSQVRAVRRCRTLFKRSADHVRRVLRKAGRMKTRK